MLFGGDFKQHGLDLILSKDGRDFTIHDYFKGSRHPDLASPDGARLNASLVDALTAGHTQYAQAGGTPADAPKVIGQVTKLTGSATAIRNGVAVELNVGDNVMKGDVVQAGASSNVSLTFIDGTVFGLSANARMVLNEMVYDPSGSSNTSLMSLVQGTITFVAGETAKHGDMKVDTPVATMGIRGTAVLVELGFEVTGPNAEPMKVQVLLEPGNVVGSFELRDKVTGTLLGVVNQQGVVNYVSSGGNVTQAPAPPLPPEAKAVIDNVMSQYFGGAYTPQQDNNANPNTPNAPHDSAPPAPPPPPGGGSTDHSSNTDTGSKEPIIKTVSVPITTPDGTKSVPVDLTITKTPPVVHVTDVVDTPSFKIADEVSMTNQNGDTNVPYVTGSAILKATTQSSPYATSIDLTKLIHINLDTGQVTYDPTQFNFLSAGEKAVFTIDFTSSSGPFAPSEELTLTIDGVNVTPTVAGVDHANTTERTDITGSQQVDVASGTFTVTDPNLSDTHTVTNKLLSAVWSNGAIVPAKTVADLGTALQSLIQADNHAGNATLAWNFKLTDSDLDFLAKGETLTVQYELDVTDSSGTTNASAVPEILTLTLFANNDQPDLLVETTPVAQPPVNVFTLPFSNTAFGQFNKAGFDLAGNPDGGFTAIWSDTEANGPTLVSRVHLQDLDPTGAAIGSTKTLSFTTTLLQADDNGFSKLGVLYLDDASGSLRFQVYDLNGNALTTARAIFTNPFGSGSSHVGTFPPGGIDVTHNADGSFNVFWLFDDTVGGNTTVHAHAVTVSADGNTVGATTDLTLGSSVAELQGDTNDLGQTALAYLDGNDLKLEVLDANGHPIASPATVFSNAGGGSFKTGGLDVIHRDDGSFVVAWSFTDSNNVAHTYAKAFSATGVQVSSQVEVPNAGGAFQLAVDGAGDVGVVYPNGQDLGFSQITFTPLTYGVTELSNTTNGATPDTISGFVPLTDADLDDTHTVDSTLVSSVWSGGSSIPSATLANLAQSFQPTVVGEDKSGFAAVAWTFSRPDRDFDFLAAGETLTLQYQLTVTDDSGAPNASSPPLMVTITLTGTNDTPTITSNAAAAVAAFSEASGTNNSFQDVASGTITFADVDLNDTHHTDQTIVPTGIAPNNNPVFTWSHGALSPALLSSLEANTALQLVQHDSIGTGAGSVDWTFRVFDNALDFLAKDETLTVTYNVTITDNNGASTDQPITVTITGINDTPSLSVDTSGAGGTGQHGITEAAGTNNTGTTDSAGGTLYFTDVDLDDTHTVSKDTPTFVWSAGTLTQAQIATLTAASSLALTKHDSTDIGAGSIDFTYSAADNSFDFLAKDETLTITYHVTVTDNNSAFSEQAVTIMVTGANDTPAITVVDAAGAVTEDVNPVADNPNTAAAENGGFLVDTGSVTFADVDLTDHEDASVALTGSATTSGAGISAQLQTALTSAMKLPTTHFDSNTGAIGWSFALDNNLVQYLAQGETVTATYTITLKDDSGDASSNATTQTVTVTITGANDTPAITVVDAIGAVTEDVNPVADNPNTATAENGSFLVDTGSVTFADVDLTDHEDASVALTGSATTSGAGISAQLQTALTSAMKLPTTHFDSNTGAIGWSFALDNNLVQYLAQGETVTATYTITLKDDSGDASSNATTQTVTVTISGANDGLVITAGNTIGYTEQAASVVLDNAITLTDLNSQTLASATATISSGYLAGDTLTISGATDGNYVGQSGTIHFHFDAANAHAMALSGAASLADYQAAMRLIAFSNTTSDNPTAYGTDTGRTVTWAFNDGTSFSSTSTTTVNITPVNDPPAITNVSAGAAYTENAVGTVLSPTLTVIDPDNTNLTSATVKIASGFVAGDVLSANVVGTTIIASYNGATGVLTLSGSDTIAHYQQVLDSVAFSSSSDNPTNGGASPTRSISWQVNDGTVSFQGSNNVATPDAAPTAVTVGDFNGDGKLDLAVANGLSNTVSVLLGDGTGGFGPATNYATGGGERFVTIGDFNGDSKLDLAVADQGVGSVSVLLGDGTGGFGTATTYVTGGSPTNIAVGDLNGDGKQDLVVAVPNTNNLSLLFGNGLGGFAPAINIASGGLNPEAVVIRDFNGDGKADLAVTNVFSNSISVLLGNGSGGFGAPVSFATGSTPRDIAVGDFNGDGISDLVVSNSGDNSVSVLLGNGTGGFGPAANFATGSTPYYIVVKDFNGDGKADIVVADYGSSAVSLLLGDGQGGFGPATNLATGANPLTIAAGDFNGDGLTDLSVADAGGHAISVLLNNSNSLSAIGQTNVAVTATNDAPVINGGPVIGTLVEDGTPAQQTVTGQLTETDPDKVAAPTWKVVNGTNSHPADFSFAVDNLTVTRNSQSIVNDPFNTAPGSANQAYSYAVDSTAPSQHVLDQASGRALLDNNDAVPTTGIGTTQAFVTANALLLTGTDPNGATTLTKEAAFTVDARFDLTLPDDLNQGYGIRLSDRVPGTVGGTNGDDVTELRVVRGLNGGYAIQFRDIDFTDTSNGSLNGVPLGNATVLQQFGINPASVQAGEQIAFHFSHAANSTAISASYDLYDVNGIQLDANGAAPGLTNTFTISDNLFSDEDYTQVQIHSFSEPTDNSYLTGTYGTLSIDPTGAYTYAIQNGSTAVQNLRGGQQVTDTFNIQVSDGQGGTDSTTATFTVTGKNDTPVVTGATSPASQTEAVDAHAQDIAAITGTMTVSDLDIGDTLAGSITGNAVARLNGSTTLPNGVDVSALIASSALTFTGTVTSNGGVRTLNYTYDPAAANLDFLKAGDILTVTYTAQVSDGTVTTGSQPLVITIAGANDAPVLDASKSPTFGSVVSGAAPVGQVGVLVSDIADFSGITNVTDVDSPSVGIAITGVNANGTLWYSADNGANWVSYNSASVSDTNAILIPANSRLYFQANAGASGNIADAITFRAWDQTSGPAGSQFNITGNGGTGGSSAFSSASDTVSVAVGPGANGDTINNAAAPSASSGWVLNTANGHYYRLVTNALDWNAASTAAQADGAYLATVTSQAEQNFVTPLAAGYRAWLGGLSTDDATGTGHFFWMTGPEAGQAFQYTNWRNLGGGAFEPNGGDGASEAVHIEGVDDPANGGWNDASTGALGRVYLEEWGGLQNQIAFRENASATIAASLLLANDSGSANKSISGVGATSAQGGTVSLSNGIITYTPVAGYYGADSFTYTIIDNGLPSTATVSFNVDQTVFFVGDNQTQTFNVDNDTINVTGANATVTVNGWYDVVNVSGTNDVVTLTGAHDVVSMTGASKLSLVGATISSAGAGISAQTADPSSGDTLNVALDNASSIAVSGAGNAGLALTTAGANISITTTGSVSSSGGDGIDATVQGGTGNISITALGGVSGSTNSNPAQNVYYHAIQAINHGDGNISIEAAGAIAGGSRFGIRAQDFGKGNISITTDAGTTINSGGSGINVVKQATSIATLANSTITVTTAAGTTINSGTVNNPSGSVPSGIVAGFFGANGTANTAINGTVIINNGANITAAAGYGVQGYNYGSGDVTINEAAGTTVSAANYGIVAFGLSGGTGNVTVNVGANSTIRGTSTFGIEAYNVDNGNVSVTTSAGDVINSGGVGIFARGQSTTESAGNTVQVIAHGSITSASIAGIDAGYYSGTNTVEPNVLGDVIVQSDATIVANGGGNGINAYTWGVGSVSVTASAGSSITSAGIGISAGSSGTAIPVGESVHVVAHGSIHAGNSGINAYYSAGGTNQPSATVAGDIIVESDATIVSTGAIGISAFDMGTGNVTITTGANSSTSGKTGVGVTASLGGNVSIENNGQISATNFSGINVNQNSVGATGSTTITNTGSVVGATNAPAIAVNSNSTGTVTINNTSTGVIGPVANTGTAIFEGGGGTFVVNNYGQINGSVGNNVGTFVGTFNNNAGAIWRTAFINDDGSIAASGAGSAITITNAQNGVNVGFNGTGGLNLAAGASLTTGFLNVGQNVGSHGTVLVTGTGTSLNTTSGQFSNISVGLDGTASLTVADHAVVTTNNLSVASNYDAGVTDTLDVNNATLNALNFLTIGFAGAANATVENGGIINAGHLSLAQNAGGTASLTVTGAGSLVSVGSNFGLSATQSTGTLTVTNGGAVDIATTDTVANAVHIGSSGFFVGPGTVNADVVNDGNVTVFDGALHITGAASGSGTFFVAGGLLEFGGSVAATDNVVFQNLSATLKLDDAAHFSAHINFFAGSDAIDLTGFNAASTAITTSFNGVNTVLTVTDATHTLGNGGAAQINLESDYTASTFGWSDDGQGGVRIALDAVPVIDTTSFTLSHNGSTTTVSGLSVTDSDATANEIFSVSTAVDHGSVTPSSTSGTLSQINAVFATGVTYDPGATPPDQDKITLTVTDRFGQSDTVHFVFGQGATGPLTLTGTAGKDVIFASGEGDTLTGNGGADQFVFSPHSGSNPTQSTITDFDTTLDKIDLRQFSGITASNLPTETQQGSDTLLTLDSNDTVLLKNVLLANLHASDFIVHS